MGNVVPLRPIVRPSEMSLRAARLHLEDFMKRVDPGERLELRSARLVQEERGQGACKLHRKTAKSFVAVELVAGEHTVDEVLIAATTSFTFAMQDEVHDVSFVPFKLARKGEEGEPTLRFNLRPEEPS